MIIQDNIKCFTQAIYFSLRMDMFRKINIDVKTFKIFFFIIDGLNNITDAFFTSIYRNVKDKKIEEY